MENELLKIKSCEVCGNDELISVLDLGMHPMCDDLIAVGDNRVCKEYPIEILYCNKCFTAHQRFQIPKQDLFPSSYHYRSRFTADVLNGMISLVESCQQKFGSLSGKKVLDIGCNDGSLLDFFREQGAVTIGIEPTGASADAKEKGHSVYNKYLAPDIAHEIVEANGQPDFITFTNVFAHIENLAEVVESLKILMSPSTVIVIENHYLGAVLSGNQFDTFYHEHPRTYSYNSFKYIAGSLGLNVLNVEFPSRYGGNIRIMMGDVKLYAYIANDDTDLLEKEATFFDEFAIMNENIRKWNVKMKETLASCVAKYGTIKAKAFPGRAAILVKLLGLDTNVISAAYEKPGSMKIGHYLPGTRIPILSDDELMTVLADEKVLLNLAWHIKKEIGQYLTDKGFKGELVNIL